MMNLTDFGGRTGNCKILDVYKLGAKISSNLFTFELLSMYTWSRKSKTDATKKNSIKFEKIQNLFFDVIKMACRDYTVDLNENLFKNNLLKHAKTRMEREKKK